MNSKIAIPTENGVLTPHFGHAPEFTIVDIENGEVASTRVISAPAHEPGVLPTLLADLEVTDVIVGGIGSQAIALFEANGVRVCPGAPSLPVETIVGAFIKGDLDLKGNSCDH